jgi:hypothetical protein
MKSVLSSKEIVAAIFDMPVTASVIPADLPVPCGQRVASPFKGEGESEGSIAYRAV